MSTHKQKRLITCEANWAERVSSNEVRIALRAISSISVNSSYDSSIMYCRR